MPEKIHVEKGIGKIGTLNGDVYVDSKKIQNFNPTPEWAKEKIEIALKSIGNRYITYNRQEYIDLNQKTDIQKFFQYTNNILEFSIDDFLVFFNIDNLESFNNHFKEFSSIYKEYTGEKALKILNNKQFYQENGIQIEYYEFFSKYINDSNIIKNSAYLIQKTLEMLRDFLITDKSELLGKDFCNSLENIERIANASKKLYETSEVQSFIKDDDYGWRFLPTLLTFYSKYLSVFKSFFIDYNFNTDTFVHNINKDNKLSTYLFKYTFIVGEAMSGKTHMLSDIANTRIKAKKPTILIYAQKFEGYKTPIQHIIYQLGLEKYQYTDDEFLQILNEWGKNTNELVFLIVDAINETTDKKVWRDNFIDFVSKVKKYSYIALIMSIRDVEKRTIFDHSINSFIKKEMIEIEHKGFESIEYPVLKKFCEVFEIEMPSFPLLSPVFSNPGLLFLFFETMKRNDIHQIDERVLKPNFIIEEYIKDRNNHFKILNKITDRRTFIHRGTNIIASEMIKESFVSEVSYDSIFEDINQIHTNLLDYLISEGILLENYKSLDEIYLYFSYQRFGNYFLALYLLNGEFDRDTLPNKKIIRSLLLSYTQQQALVEALIVRLSESYRLDFIDIFPDLFEDNDLNFIRYKCFSKALVLPTSISEKIDNVFNLDFEEKYNILDLLLHFSHEKSNQFNIEKTLHLTLLSQNMSERDYHWSIYLHYSYVDDGIVKRIIDWAWNKKEEFEIDNESLYLYGLTLGWFLTSSNRELRDGATKALVNLFTNNVDVFLRVLREFEAVDDLYLLERLYAVGYGIVLRSSKVDGFRDLGEYIYQTIFDTSDVIEHILIRDYAKLAIEYIDKTTNIGIDIEKIYPPYNQSMEWELPTIGKEHLEQYQNDYSSIYWSVLYGDFKKYVVYRKLNHFMNLKIKDRPHPKSQKQRYDEFFDALTSKQKDEYEKTKLQPNERLSIVNQDSFDDAEEALKQENVEAKIENLILQTQRDLRAFKKMLSPQQLQEYHEFIVNYKSSGRYEKGIDVKSAKRYIFLETIKMGWSKELFEKFDREIGSYSRKEHTVERIGKKYQWIAFYQVLAKLTDHYEFREESYSEYIGEYKGVYQLSSTRNVDPSSILKRKKNIDDIWWINLNKSLENTTISDREWMGSIDKLPTIEGCVSVKKDDEEFLVQSLSFSVDGNNNGKTYRNLYYQLDSFLIQKKSLEGFIEWLNTVDYFGQDKLPQSSSLHDMYLREYPNGEAFKYFDKYYYGQMDWDDSFDHIEGAMPTKILLTSTSYMNEASSYDKSLKEAIEIKLPNKWFIQEMNLRQTLNDGEWIDKEENVVFLDPTVSTGGITSYNDNGVLVSNKKLLTEFLESKGLTQVWIVWGEKQVRSTKNTHDDKEFLGFGEIMGYGYFDGDEFVEEINIRYDK